MNISGKILPALVCAVLVQAGSVSATVNLRFTPADTTVTAGTTNRLSIMIDDLDANVRTIDVYVDYDTTVVASMDGAAGALYDASGFFVFQGIENNVPGQWHGYAVVMGSEDFLEGPGELYYWEYEALADGTTPVTAVEVYVAAGDGTYYQDIVLEGTTINVFDPLSAAPDVPARQGDLKAWPNPFNPRTTLSTELAVAGPGRMVVYDMRGREVVVLFEGELPGGPASFVWDGRDDGGQLQPAGSYLFQLRTGTGTWTTRATLVK